MTMANDDDIIQFGGYFDGEGGEKIERTFKKTTANVMAFVAAIGDRNFSGEFPCYDFPKMYRGVVEATELALYIGTEDIEPSLPDSPVDPGRN